MPLSTESWLFFTGQESSDGSVSGCTRPRGFYVREWLYPTACPTTMQGEEQSAAQCIQERRPESHIHGLPANLMILVI